MINRQIGNSTLDAFLWKQTRVCENPLLTNKAKVSAVVFILDLFCILIIVTPGQHMLLRSVEEVAWEQETKLCCNVHNLHQQTALAGTCPTNERRKNPNIYFSRKAYCWLI